MPKTIIAVEWNGEEHSIALGTQSWSKICRGLPTRLRGPGYWYEGQFHQDYWCFGGGMEGDLVIEYDNDGGQVFVGKLCDARIEVAP